MTYDEMDMLALLERYTPNDMLEIRQCKLDVAWRVWFKKASFARDNDIIKEVNFMARTMKGKRDEQPKTPAASSVKKSTRWVDYDIRTKDEKNAVREYSKEVDTILDTLVMLLDEGYDLVCKRRDEGATVTAMLFCNVGGHAHNGHALSANAPDAWLALTALVYKHTVGLQGIWTSGDDTDDSDSAW